MNRKFKEPARVNPNPRIVALLDYAMDEITARLMHKERYPEWLAWAAEWKRGKRSPAACVNASHQVTRNRESDPIAHTLGQLAWGAKEACYNVPQSGWLVVRYIADAMVAFGVAYPDNGFVPVEPPTIDDTAADLTGNRRIEIHRVGITEITMEDKK